MRAYRLLLPLAIFFLTLYANPIKSQELSEPAAKALAEGEAFRKQRDYERALSAYRKADKLSHHTCADCFIGMFRVDRELGNLQAALDDTKEAVKAAGDDKPKAVEAHLLRSGLLARMASKPNDKKLREAESEVRQVLALAPGLAIAHLGLGKILIRQERDSEGILELKAYLASPDTDPKSRREARRIIADPIRGREPFAPDFSFVTLEDESLSNASLRGKVVLFDFWGTWCPVCRESLPMVLNLRKKYRDRPFQIVGVSSDDDEQLWERFIAANQMDWPEFLDSSNVVRQAFDVNAYPTFIIVDRDGVITYNQSGWSTDMQGELEEVINKALKKPSNRAFLAAAAASVPEEPPPKPQMDTGTPPQAGATVPAERNLPSAEAVTAPAGLESSSARAVETAHAPEQSAPSFHLRDIRQAEILQRSGHLEEAIKVFRQAIQSQPNDIKCHRLLADALVQKGDRAGAIVEYQEIVKLEPDNAEDHFMLGAQLEAQGATAGYTRDDFKPQTKSSQPGNLALPKTALADYEAALEQYALAHKLAPRSPVYNEAYERMKSRLMPQ